jgi:multidrug efflux system membrane fusion protein
MKLSPSVKTALAIGGAIALYFGGRMLFADDAPESSTEVASELFQVVAETVKPEISREEVRIRARTEAFRKVLVRAETAGAVEATPVEPGTLVEEGAVLCKVEIDARAAGAKEARAALAKAKLDHDAAVRLAAEGFRSETAVAAARAALDLARANLEQADVALAKTSITAPWAGVFDQRLAEIGDYLNVGDPCGLLIQQTPFLVVGAVSERDVARISQGDRGVARLATGEVVEGEVRVVAKSSDDATRTFEVQLEVPNQAGALRDGVTADLTIFASERAAHLVPRSALTLDDEGRLGLRIVGADDIVDFAEVTLVGEAANGAWVEGLQGEARVITRGQDFVAKGQRVAVVMESARR